MSSLHTTFLPSTPQTQWLFQFLKPGMFIFAQGLGVGWLISLPKSDSCHSDISSNFTSFELSLISQSKGAVFYIIYFNSLHYQQLVYFFLFTYLLAVFLTRWQFHNGRDLFLITPIPSIQDSTLQLNSSQYLHVSKREAQQLTGVSFLCVTTRDMK